MVQEISQQSPNNVCRVIEIKYAQHTHKYDTYYEIDLVQIKNTIIIAMDN